jgi:hypothetical protein
MVGGMEPAKMLRLTSRTLRRCNLPISAGMEPVRPVFLRSSREEREVTKVRGELSLTP